MLADSGHRNDLGNFAFSLAGQPMCVYHDPAYPLRIHVQAPYHQGRLTQQMEDYNKVMREVRVSVEGLFGDILEVFSLQEKSKDRSKQRRKNVYCMRFATKCYNLFRAVFK